MHLENVSQNVRAGWLMVIAGFIFVVIGIASFRYPWLMYYRIMAYSGYAIVFNSIMIFLHAVSHMHSPMERRVLISESILDLSAGCLLVFNPLLTVIAFPIIIGYWMTVRGWIKLLLALISRTSTHVRWIVASFGMLSLIFGGIVVFDIFDMDQHISNIIGVFSVAVGIFYWYDVLNFGRQSDALDIMA